MNSQISLSKYNLLISVYLSSAQIGRHNEKRISYGHAMVILFVYLSYFKIKFITH